MSRHICMVPSNTLSSTDASKFALKIVESPIVFDYLAYTNNLLTWLDPDVKPGEPDWWDTVSKASYVRMLVRRHKHLKYDVLMANRTLPWPDLSTLNGLNVLLLGGGDAIVRPRPGAGKAGRTRCEIYEIKPNNPSGKRDALKKLADVETSYLAYGIAGIYDRGVVYPRGGRTTIDLKSPFLRLFRYLVTLGLKPFGVTVSRVSIEVTLVADGALLYKICVDLENAKEYQRDSAWVMANFAVRMLWLAHNSHAAAAVRVAAAQFVETLQPDDPAINPRQVERIIAGRDLGKVPALILKAKGIADEVRPHVAAIRDAMYSRLIGEPGDRFFLCADEAWYQTNVRLPGTAKVAAQLRVMTAGALTTGARGSFVGLTVPVAMTADRAIGELPLIGPAYRWAVDHPAEVVIAAGCAIIVTAAVIATVLTLGAAAPVAAEVSGLALAEAAGAIGTAGATEMTGAVVIASGASEATAITTVGAVEEAGAGVRAATTLVNWAQQAARAGSTAAELAEASAQASADELLLKIMGEALVKKAVATAVGATSLAAGVAVIGVSARPAYAYSGPPSGQVRTASLGDVKQVDVGTLYAVRVSAALPTQLPFTPELYKPFEIGDYLPATQVAKVAKLYMMGAVEVG